MILKMHMVVGCLETYSDKGRNAFDFISSQQTHLLLKLRFIEPYLKLTFKILPDLHNILHNVHIHTNVYRHKIIWSYCGITLFIWIRQWREVLLPSTDANTQLDYPLAIKI